MPHIFGYVNKKENTKTKSQILEQEFLSSWGLIRGDRYPCHEYEHCVDLLEPQNGILQEVYSITAHRYSRRD